MKKATTRIKNQDWLFVHADKSDLVVNPPENERTAFLKLVHDYRVSREQLMQLREETSETLDKVKMHLEANIGRESDLELVHKFNAEGVGLFPYRIFIL